MSPLYAVGAVEGPDGWVEVTIDIPEAVYRDLFAHTIAPMSLSMIPRPPVPPALCPERPDAPLPLGERVHVPGRLR